MMAIPFWKLPPELRNQAYELVLCHPETIVVEFGSERPRLHGDTAFEEHILGLTGTCKKIRSETLPMFYSMNNFRLRTCQLEENSKRRAIDPRHSGWRGGIDHWIRSVGGENIAYIEELEIRAGCWKVSANDFRKTATKSLQNLLAAFEGIKVRLIVDMVVCWDYDQFDLKLPLNGSYATIWQLETVLQEQRAKIRDAAPIDPRSAAIWMRSFEECAAIVRMVFRDIRPLQVE